MAAGLALNTATVEFVSGELTAGWAKAAVIVRGGKLRITVGKDSVRADVPVLTVVKGATRNQWLVTTSDLLNSEGNGVLVPGGVYTVTRARGCGCGG